MGQCWSRTEYLGSSFLDEHAWKKWDKHHARKYYEIGHVLGKGAFSEVVAARQIHTGETVALKVIFLANPRLQPEHVSVLRQEYRVMSALSHPNIAKIDCVMEDRVRKQVVIAEEICLGDTLLEELQQADTNDERMLVVIFKQVFRALEYMHCRGIVHRDLKGENIIFRHPHAEWNERGACPVLIDFGMAVEYKPSKPMRGLMGSPGYVAPEVIQQRAHTPAMDMYAIGVILYTVLTGHRPMLAKEANNLSYAHYEAHEYPHMQEDVLWKAANANARDIVLKLLERDPAARLSASAALAHPWLAADLRTSRQVAAGVDVADVLPTKRSRLQTEAKQAHVEDFMRLMSLAFSGPEPPPVASPERRSMVTHTTTFFDSLAALLSRSDAGVAASEVQALLAPRDEARAELAAADPVAACGVRVGDGGAGDAAIGATPVGSLSHSTLQDRLRRHLDMSRARLGPREAPDEEGEDASIRSAASEPPPWLSAEQSGVRRLQPQRSDVASVVLRLSPELRRRKAAAEVEWCAKRWRRNARQVLRGGFTPAAAQGRRDGTREEASVIGNLAALMLQHERDSTGSGKAAAAPGVRAAGA